MRLAPESHQHVIDALADAFEGRDSFSALARRLGWRLSWLVGEGVADPAIIDALVARAERTDNVAALLEAARLVNPSNVRLASIEVASLAFERAPAPQMHEVLTDHRILVRDALLAGFPSAEELTGLLSSTHRHGASAWRDSWPISDSLLRCVSAAVDEGWITELLEAAVERRPGDGDLKALADELRGPAVRAARAEAPEEALRRCSELSGGFFLINRAPLRASLARMLPPTGNRVLVVQGENGSGLSHSLRLIYHLRDTCGFSISEVDLDLSCRRLGPRNTFTPLRLAEEIVTALEYEDLPLPCEPGDRQWSAWIVDFVREFERRAASDPRRIYLVLDALNKVRLNQATTDLIAALSACVAMRLSRFRLVLVGYRSDLPPGLRQALLVDRTGEITQADVAEFFDKVHKEAEVAIDEDDLLQKVVNVLQGQQSAPPGKLLDLAGRVLLEMPGR